MGKLPTATAEFYRPDALARTKATVSKHLKADMSNILQLCQLA